MSSTLLAPSPRSRAVPRGRPDRPAGLTWLPLLLLVALVVVHAPAFVCMPLDADATHYDLCARVMLDGGRLYRDALDTNLPGMPWLHAAIRAVAGWRSEVMQGIDLVVAGLIVLLLVGWVPMDARAGGRGVAALVLGGYYLSTSEWCHVQRDVWMLLPALLALSCRRRQVQALVAPGPNGWASVGRPLLEGLLWGAAFWIKPFVAVPCLLCWLAGARMVWRETPRPLGRLACDGMLVLLGGLAAGAAGVAWLVATGTWAAFWDLMTAWVPQYGQADLSDGRGTLMFAGFVIRFLPWVLVHVAAVPLAICDLWRGRARALLAGMYLGWLAQAALLQHLYDYVQVPPVLLGLTLVCSHWATLPAGQWRTVVLACLLLGLAVRLPGPTVERLAVWDRCWREGSSTELRDRLSVLHRMSWSDLEHVEDFLRQQGVRDGEVTCWSPHPRPLHQHLGIRLATRYFLLHLNLRVFVRQREQIWADVAASRQRFVIVDVLSATWKGKRDLDWEPPVPGIDDPDRASFPHDRLVFRAGRYAVYALDGAAMRAWVEQHLDL
jgi:hypothetical protein